MTRKDSKEMDPTQFMDTVVRNSTRFWEGMAGFSWPSQGADTGSAYNPWEPAMEAWKQFQESCSPEAFADPFEKVRDEGVKQFEKMAKSGWEHVMSMGEGFTPSMNWAKPPFGLGLSELFGGKDIFKELLKLMSGEMNQFISIPPLGLSRNYQEKVVAMVEKGNQFLLTLAEYMFLMFSPLEQSMRMVQASMEGLTDEQRQSLTPETVYETWLKELEQGYFTLYGSEEYLGLLKRLVAAMGEFNLARQNFMSDCLKLMGVPSENDLDDLYRDLYSIKKKLSSLENSVEKMTQSVMAVKPGGVAEATPKETPAAVKSPGVAATQAKEAPAAVKPAGKASGQAKGATKPAKSAAKAAAPKAAAKSPEKAEKQTAKSARKTS